MSAESEQELLSAVLGGTLEDYNRARAYGVMDEHFGSMLAVWQWITKYVEQYGKLPEATLVNVQWPAAGIIKVDGDVLWHAQRVHNEYVVRTARTVMGELGDKPLAEDPDSALRQIIDRLMSIRPASKRNLLYLDGDAGVRLASTEARHQAVQAGGNPFSGIRTGFEPVDIMGEGWVLGTINAIVGNTSTGKSEMALRSMVEAWLLGIKTLIVSPEMPANLLGWRADPILSFLMKQDDAATNREVMRGDMSSEHMEQYRKLIAHWQERHDLAILDTFGREEVVTVGEVRNAAREHNARLVIVDGFRLLNDQRRGDSSVTRNQNVIRDLLAMSAADGIATILVEHTSSDVKKQTELPEIGQIYMGPALNQWCDKMITLAMTRTDPAQRIMAMPKNRRGTPFFKRKVISFDVDKGDIGRWVETLAQQQNSDIGRFLPGGGEVAEELGFAE